MSLVISNLPLSSSHTSTFSDVAGLISLAQFLTSLANSKTSLSLTSHSINSLALSTLTVTASKPQWTSLGP
ncbi:hypothetical protein CFP56_039809 [Quercus suber]|uniref:Uncharacterized protein n=1 Tax=Quercus suber TaxID=58331 RepID=A0AAW0LL83_QUESU